MEYINYSLDITKRLQEPTTEVLINLNTSDSYIINGYF